MTSRPALAALLLALAATLAPLAASTPPSEGPYVGQVAQGETDVFVYDNTPVDGICPDSFAPVAYTVALAYAPAPDTLTLEVLGRSTAVEGRNGAAAVTFEGNGCETFLLAVTGTRVAAAATYTLSVTMHAAVDDAAS